MNLQKVRNLFRLKSKNPQPACAMYVGVFTCKENYIVENKRHVEIRWGEHSDINKRSEPSRHLKSNPTHVFTWKVLMTGPINDRVRRNLEASFIVLSRPSLNEKIDAKKLLLFRNIYRLLLRPRFSSSVTILLAILEVVKFWKADIIELLTFV